MDNITKYLNRIAYKFPKGYPDMNNDQDKAMLFEMVEDIISEKALAWNDIAGESRKLVRITTIANDIDVVFDIYLGNIIY